MKVHNFKDLKVWNLSVDLATKAYKITQKFPADERYGSTTQAQRSAISIASNIAEGCGRIGKGDFMRFVSISMGSSYELETQITISFKLGYINEEELLELETDIRPIQKMLFKLYDSLETTK